MAAEERRPILVRFGLQEVRMPRIIVASSDVAGAATEALLSERVEAANFANEHFRNQLVERLGWAVGDADRLEDAQRREVAP
jgi:hypothetical protein